MPKPYCPFCRSEKPLIKSGWQLRVGGRPPKQRYHCRNKGCYRMTTKPKWQKPRAKKEGKKEGK